MVRSSTNQARRVSSTTGIVTKKVFSASQTSDPTSQSCAKNGATNSTEQNCTKNSVPTKGNRPTMRSKREDNRGSSGKRKNSRMEVGRPIPSNTEGDVRTWFENLSSGEMRSQVMAIPDVAFIQAILHAYQEESRSIGEASGSTLSGREGTFSADVSVILRWRRNWLLALDQRMT